MATINQIQQYDRLVSLGAIPDDPEERQGFIRMDGKTAFQYIADRKGNVPATKAKASGLSSADLLKIFRAVSQSFRGRDLDAAEVARWESMSPLAQLDLIVNSLRSIGIEYTMLRSKAATPVPVMPNPEERDELDDLLAGLDGSAHA